MLPRLVNQNKLKFSHLLPIKKIKTVSSHPEIVSRFSRGFIDFFKGWFMALLKGRILSIGGGKGGVGKSFIASALSCGLALKGFKVVLVDGDLAGANIHTFFGIKYPSVSLRDYLKKRANKIEDVLIPTKVKNLQLICGASGLIEIANPKYTQKRRLINALSGLNADYIIVDIGAGASFNNLDFFNMADIGIIVTTPTPTALQNAYEFLKMALNRKILNSLSDQPNLKKEVALMLEGQQIKNYYELLQFIKSRDENTEWKIVKLILESRYRLIVNMSTKREGTRISKALSGATYQFLRVGLPCIGIFPYTPEVENSIRRMQPLMLSSSHPLSEYVTETMEIILSETRSNTKEQNVEIEKREKEPTARQTSFDKLQSAQPLLCLNNEVSYNGKKLHVQTEDLGSEKSQILTLVFSGGHILFSKATDYKEILTDQNKDNLQQRIAERVRWQHKAVIAGIAAGRLDINGEDNGEGND